jgi:Tfp pilus assembly protein PilF
MDIDKSIQAPFKYLQAGNLHQAENICWKILEIQPDNADAMHFLGVIFYSSGNYDLAIQNIKKSLHEPVAQTFLSCPLIGFVQQALNRES